MITCKRKQKTDSRQEEASLFLLSQKRPVCGTAPLYWLLSWLAVNWKIANESSMFCLCCNVLGHYVLSCWAEQSRLWCGACLDYMGYLMLSGKCRDWGRSPLRRSCWGRLRAQEGSDLPHPLPRQSASGYSALRNLYIYLPESIYSLPPPPNIHRNTQGLCFWALLRVHHAQSTYKNTWENGLQTFPSRFSIWGGWEPVCSRTRFCHPEAGKWPG